MPFKGYQTYYRIVGEPTDNAPLLLIHGGPGSTHNYFEVLDDLAVTTRRQIISYDQIGCGESYVDGHPELWTLTTWLDELEALRSHLHLNRVNLLGQSWGGMLIIAYMIDRHPEGIESIILSSTLPSSELWSHEQQRLISFMPDDEQEAIARAVATGNFDDPAYLKANDHYTVLHADEITDASPECLRRPKRFGTESYLTAWGPNEYTPTGTLRDFDYTDRLGEITDPTLIISGTNDECTPLIAKTMDDNMPNAIWELLDGARHMTFIDQTDTYKQLLIGWLMS
ncbi:proline iminopeptidase [Prevotella lacticifex]|uniref:Proline iminopeptidase n=2 Tax=Prevotella lacticifex TaxID=2854755 RepID=A0A9R1CV82_9BACT|nr:proline iminopeptidase [Prevotella lacticifex]GJG41182.1 proline iminopeptidase [Prevotella lacticifex]GJG46462.1 proline iminopeptidase [Prevotella lacticifex]GJG50222.1 proline iminopeptidase [Prevotella lacticifex]GJG53794.1 proline iminopeptidase [Prevotella lacticifex]